MCWNQMINECRPGLEELLAIYGQVEYNTGCGCGGCPYNNGCRQSRCGCGNRNGCGNSCGNLCGGSGSCGSGNCCGCR